MKTLVVLAGVLAAHVASAATIGGTITTGGAPLASAEVRLWAFTAKGWVISQTVAANGAGAYTFTVGAANYLVDARGPAGSGANYGDRWYDVAAPNSMGYVGESADIIAIATGSSVVTGIDIAMEVLGGVDGTITNAGGPAASIWVRVEDRTDFRIEHDDFSKSLPLGLISFRGMVPSNNYEIIAYDPTGNYDTLLAPGPYGIASNAVGALGTLTLPNNPADPYEGNNTPNCGAASIDAGALHADPPVAWDSSSARLAPLGDVDWFCYPADAGDRLILTTSTAFMFSGNARVHPWTDPVMSVWRGARVTKLVENDDGAGNLDAKIDTGPLTAGCHCVAVTTFGDANFQGAGQNSTGAYRLHVAMGNRPPVPSIKKGASELPDSPATFFLDEGDQLTLDLAYLDADHDVPGKTFAFVDGSGTPVTATVTLGANAGTFDWTAPPDAAAKGPYTMTLTANDTEFTLTKTVTIVARSVNMLPLVPALVTPAAGAIVTTGTPAMTWSAVTDPDGDPVHYDLEIYQGGTDGVAAQSGSNLAVTSFTPTTIAENTRVSWRVRAGDDKGGLSAWSAFGTFLVDSANDPPGDPILIKPAANELLAMRRPGLSVLGVEDPEDDAITYTFEISRDIDFVDLAWTSPAVPADLVSSTTMTGTGIDLEWGREYWARVQAVDARGGTSAWSEKHFFKLKVNAPPSNPTFSGGCMAITYDDGAPDKIIVTNPTDPENEPVTFAFQMFDYDAGVASTPIYETTAPLDIARATTAIPLDLSAVPNGHYRYVVRAFDGTDYSEPIECEMTLEVPAVAGGCCDAGGSPFGASLGAAIVGLGLVRSRRRRFAPRRPKC